MRGSTESGVTAQQRRPFAFFRKGSRAEGGGERPIVRASGIYKFFGPSRPVLRDASLEVARNEFVFITGPSGAGKSTLLSLLYRGLQSDAGALEVCGHDLTRLPEARVWALRRHLGLVFQDFKLVDHWSVAENCALPLEILRLSGGVIRVRVGEALERVGLSGVAAAPARSLSGGEKQRLAIARAIVHEPKLLLADEPTGNLDPQLSIDILSLFEELNREGTTVVFATHDHALIGKTNHRTLALDEGVLAPLARQRSASVTRLVAAS